MTPELQALLLTGPKTQKDIATALNLSPGRVRALLKEDQKTILCRKDDNNQNIFWLEPEAPATVDDSFEASPEELASQTIRQDIQAVKDPSAAPEESGSNSAGATTCPLCKAEADQVKAGPDGTYMGAARTCSACNRTYNIHTKEEVKMAKDKTAGSKRAAPLNPQYKINQRIAAAEQAGGKLTYQREGRTWLLSKKGVEPKSMSAQEFSNETAETIHKYLGYTPPAAPAKAEKPAAPAKAPKADKPAKTPAKASGGKKAGASAKKEKDLVGA